VRIWRYDLSKGFSARPENIAIGDWVKPLIENAQLEALTLSSRIPCSYLRNRDLEMRTSAPRSRAYPGTASPNRARLSVVPHDPFSVTSASQCAGRRHLPAGAALFADWRGRAWNCAMCPRANVREGARLEGKVVANLAFIGANIDNMEGIADPRGPKGETLLYMISDNNFSARQRTLLLMFELMPVTRLRGVTRQCGQFLAGDSGSILSASTIIICFPACLTHPRSAIPRP
jgi:hypothetical protein